MHFEDPFVRIDESDRHTADLEDFDIRYEPEIRSYLQTEYQEEQYKVKVANLRMFGEERPPRDAGQFISPRAIRLAGMLRQLDEFVVLRDNARLK